MHASVNAHCSYGPSDRFCTASRLAQNVIALDARMSERDLIAPNQSPGPIISAIESHLILDSNVRLSFSQNCVIGITTSSLARHEESWRSTPAKTQTTLPAKLIEHDLPLAAITAACQPRPENYRQHTCPRLLLVYCTPAIPSSLGSTA
jgi:hypothetical protein